VTAPDRDAAATSAPLSSTPQGARVFLETQVDAALAPFRGTMPDADLAWIRERMLESAAEEGDLASLVRAAFPRDVDGSGEVFYSVKPTR
jgi:hypothetical protein